MAGICSVALNLKMDTIHTLLMCFCYIVVHFLPRGYCKMEFVNKDLAAVSTYLTRGRQGSPQAGLGFVWLFLKVIRRKEGLFKILTHAGVISVKGSLRLEMRCDFGKEKRKKCWILHLSSHALSQSCKFPNLTHTCIP